MKVFLLTLTTLFGVSAFAADNIACGQYLACGQYSGISTTTVVGGADTTRWIELITIQPGSNWVTADVIFAVTYLDNRQAKERMTMIFDNEGNFDLVSYGTKIGSGVCINKVCEYSYRYSSSHSSTGRLSFSENALVRSENQKINGKTYRLEQNFPKL